MGLIKAAVDAVSGGLADQWLEVYEADDMGDQTVFTSGVMVRRGQNRKGTDNTVSNGSIIYVYDNQFMMLVDGGKIVDYTAEPGYYKVDNSSMPSLFNGQLKDTVKETFSRIKFGGQTPTTQKVFFINLQEIKGIKFGTTNPVNYFDTFYNAELFLRAHGTYSIKIVDPLRFYAEAIPKNESRVEFTDISRQYQSEFMGAFQTALNQLSAKGMQISFVTSKSQELSEHMASALDKDWNQMRGIEVQAVGIDSISYDDKSRELIDTRNEGAMLSDPSVAQGYMIKNLSQGIKDAGSNSAGAMTGFMGVGMGASAMGGMMNGFSQMNPNAQGQMPNQRQPQNPQNFHVGNAVAAAPEQNTPDDWTCACGAVNSGKFCSECGQPKPVVESKDWTCACGAVNSGKFCSECGKPKPVDNGDWTCACGAVNTGKFCSECGKPRA